MPFGRQARGVDEIRLRQPDVLGVFGHLLGEGILGAGDALGEDDAGVVARLHGDALDEIGDAHHRVERREHGRAARRRAACPPGMLAHLELILELEAARLQLAEHDGERHELAHARRRHQRVGILLEEDEIGVGIHEDGVLGLGLEPARSLGRSLLRRRGTRGSHGKHGECHGELDQFIKARSVHGFDTSDRFGQAPAHPLRPWRQLSSARPKKATRQRLRPLICNDLCALIASLGHPASADAAVSWSAKGPTRTRNRVSPPTCVGATSTGAMPPSSDRAFSALSLLLNEPA